MPRAGAARIVTAVAVGCEGEVVELEKGLGDSRETGMYCLAEK